MAIEVQRIFLGWDGPALARAAEWLLDRHGDKSGEADLGDLLVVVPGGRARRMLMGMLVDEAERRQAAMIPPAILTPGEIPAALLGPAGNPAPLIARRLAWMEALRSPGGASLEALLPQPMDENDLAGWSRVAAALERASDELAGDGLRFADVPARAGEWLPEEEAARWATLAGVQERAAGALAEHGLVDDALATREHVFSAEDRQEEGNAPPRRDIVLLSVPELNDLERRAIERGARRVDALIFAPESLAARFDAFGCVDVAAWSAAPVKIAERRVVFTSDPREQAEQALARLGPAGAPVDVGEVVIGVADPEALPRLRRRAALASGVTLRSARGDAITRTPPGRLLSLLGAHLREFTFDTLGALVRHPDVEAALLERRSQRADESGASGSGDVEQWLCALDEIRREHVLVDPASAPSSLRPRRAEALTFVTDALRDLLGEALCDPKALRPLNEWAGALDAALQAIYAARSLHPDREADGKDIEALQQIRGALDDLEEAATGQRAAPVALAAQAIALLEERLAGFAVPEPVRRDAVETLGWLDLALDPAPRCVVVGLAESCVPGSITHDALLPDSLRERLGLRTNAARLARDAFLLSAINASRDALFLATRTGEEGDPQTPSRLLFRCSGAELARRMRRFTRPEIDCPHPARLVSRIKSGTVDQFALALRIGPGYEPPESMRVTDFGAYLRSPMGWYLERHLGLTEHEIPREMSPLHFGSLAHAALEAFGRDEEARELVDAEKISEALSRMLDEASLSMFGARPPAAVRIQTEMLRHRLGLLADWQADRRADGWRIAYVEWSPPADEGGSGGVGGASLDVAGGPMGLRGKIDRIDINERDGRVDLIDYKTGAGAKNVHSDHRKRDGQWKSLQLPLYRHLVAPLNLSVSPRLGYVGLPGSEKTADPSSFAGWSPEDLESADEAARAIVLAIRDYAAGDEIDPGDAPPSEGALGFVSGARFELGGRASEDDAPTEEES